MTNIKARSFSTEANQTEGTAASPDADTGRELSMLNFNEVIARVGEKEHNMVDYIPEAFAYVLLFEEVRVHFLGDFFGPLPIESLCDVGVSLPFWLGLLLIGWP